MIVFDTENNGLLPNPEKPLHEQPEMIEFAGIKLDDQTLEEVGRFQCLIKPRVLPLPPKVIEITHITTEMLLNERSFARVLPQLREFFLGETTCVAHNCGYDIGVMVIECRRLDVVSKFPWPWIQIDTVEANREHTDRNRKLSELHKKASGGQDIFNAHRAMSDAEALVTVVRWMREDGRI